MKKILESFGINLADVSDIKKKLAEAEALFSPDTPEDSFTNEEIELIKKLSALDLLTMSESKCAIILLVDALIEEIDEKTRNNPKTN